MTDEHREAPDAQSKRKGLSRIVHAAGYSLSGLRNAYQEPAFKQEVWLALVLLPLAFYVGKTSVERVLLIGSVLLVFIVELLNTAIERLTDLASPGWHALAKAAKDVGSGAVFVALVTCGVTWALVLLG
jgi:diacylglycerol kinase (ATP)